jgi:DNA-directed RNA polymerase subunit M/transcription elongation factor TFIIS
MIWKNLKMNWCPKCSSVITRNFGNETRECSSCDFKISEKKYREIISSQDSKKVYKVKGYDENLEALNNLSREEGWTDRPEYDENGEPNE